MFRLIKSEFLKGYLFLKLVLILFWAFLVRFYILMFTTPGRLEDYIAKGQLGFVIFFGIVLVLLTVFGLRYVFGGFRCVPYWGKKFSAFELARLMQGEVFETIDVPGAPKVKCIKNSENWVMVDNHYFYKPLSAQLAIIGGRARAYHTTRGYFTAIDGGRATEINMSFSDSIKPGVNDSITATVCMLLGDTGRDPYKNSSEISQRAFKKVWGDRIYKELLNVDMKQLKQQWLQVMMRG